MSAPAGAAPGRLLVIVLLGLAAAFQVPSTMTIGASDLLSAIVYRGFGGPESGFRWSGAHGEIVFPDPGPGWPVRVEVVLSGWRPRDQPAPLVVVTAGEDSVSVRPAAGSETVTLDTVTSGAWRSDLVVSIDSETFRPGPGDPRTLGVRVIEARLSPISSGIRTAPLGALVTGAATVLLLFLTLVGGGAPPRAAERAGIGAALALAVGYAFARAWMAASSDLLLFLVAAAALAAHLLPRPARLVAHVTAAAVRALGTGASRLVDWRVAVLCAAATLAVVTAYRTRPRVEVVLGSGGEVAVARGFGAYDAVPGLRFRRAPRGAELDLADLGGGTEWIIAVTASNEGRPRQVDLLRAGNYSLTAGLEADQWTRLSLAVPAPFGWRSGLVLTVPGGSDALRIARVDIDRGRAWPSVRIGAALLGAGLLAIVGLGAAGLSATSGLAGGGLVMAGGALAITYAPLTAIPFALPFLAIVTVSAVLAAAQSAIVAVRTETGHGLLPSPAARAAAAAGWVAWMSATAFPLYRGGHFVFHSSIAEEIWKGRFLIYYLPYPGSMLSEQAQWGNVVVPHPALYQTLAAPLSALPRPWFYLAEKSILALLFASMVIVASLLAERAAGRRAAVFAAIVSASLAPTFQLLGLGHLMTILGVCASGLALGWIAFQGRADRATRDVVGDRRAPRLLLSLLHRGAPVHGDGARGAGRRHGAARSRACAFAGRRHRRRRRDRLCPLLRALDVAVPQPVGPQAPRRLRARSHARAQAPGPRAVQGRVQLRLDARPARRVRGARSPARFVGEACPVGLGRDPGRGERRRRLLQLPAQAPLLRDDAGRGRRGRGARAHRGPVEDGTVGGGGGGDRPCRARATDGARRRSRPDPLIRAPCRRGTRGSPPPRCGARAAPSGRTS